MRLVGSNPDRLDGIKALAVTEYINQHVRFGWHFDWWPEWTLTEQRWYRASWDASTAYAAPTSTSAVEVFYFPAQKYYQSLHGTNTGNSPATLAGSGTYVENSAHWAECGGIYAADDWTANTAYAVGTRVVNPDNRRAYQCITSHTSAASFDSTKFGILTPFNRYIAYSQTGATIISAAKDAHKRDPQIFTANSGRLTQPSRGTLGVQAQADWPETVWLEFQTLAPVFSSTPWTASTAYAVGDLVYSAPETYQCITAHTSASSIDLAKFTLVEFPYLLGDFVKHCALSDYQEGLKLTQRSRVNEDRARRLLADLWDQEFPTQGQSTTARVATYA